MVMMAKAQSILLVGWSDTYNSAMKTQGYSLHQRSLIANIRTATCRSLT